MENNLSLSLIPIGGVGNVTKNMYLYEYNNEILIVDCGLGFADETMLGVDLLIPDITYLKNLPAGKRIVGMALTHGHETTLGTSLHFAGFAGTISDLRHAFNGRIVKCKIKRLR